MALFPWKKSADEGSTPSEPITFSPEKAKRFFDHARVVDEAENYEYAVQSWLSGLKQDPTAMDGLEGFFSSIAKFLGTAAAKKGLSKEVMKSVSGRTPLDRYLASLVDWGMKPTDAGCAVKAFDSAVSLGLEQPADWIGHRALGAAMRDKPRKDLFLKLTEGFEKIRNYERAVVAAEQASKLDPSNGDLSAKVRSLAAQATMTRGGFDQSGEQGGFRQNIRDQSKQRQLEESERIVKTEDTLDRLVAAAEEDYRARPTDVPAIEKLGKLWAERARGNDEARAIRLFMDTHEKTKQFRFRELAGDLKLRQARREAQSLKEAAAGGSPDKQTAFQDAMKRLGDLEVEEHRLRVEAYPTDITRKFELGRRLFMTERYEEAIPQLQDAQSDPRSRLHALNMLAQCFLKMGWVDEAIETFRNALGGKEVMGDTQMDLQYGLMTALQAKAENERDLPCAEEAEKLASSIAIKQITYKDVRARRETLKKLVLDLKA
ncbi:MAG: hypothetical protein AB7Q00_00230 [Phycisphaerales bacterium]